MRSSVTVLIGGPMVSFGDSMVDSESLLLEIEVNNRLT